MDFEELQQIQYRLCTMASVDEKTDECIFDVFWAISNLLKLQVNGAKKR